MKSSIAPDLKVRPTYVLVLALSTLLNAQTPTRDGGTSRPVIGTGTLAGIVMTDEAASRPLRRAIVTLNASDGTVAKTTITDDAGRFSFGSLPAGRYSVVATKAAYVTTYYGGKRPGRAPAVPIPLADGQSLRNVTLKMMRGGVITGRVSDPSGQALPMASVVVYEVRTISTGERIAASASGRPTYADERGIYRIYGLPPGDYVVSAMPVSSGGMGAGVRATSAADLQRAMMAIGEVRAGAPATPAVAPPPPPAVPMLGYAAVYYPGTVEFASATAIAIGAGETFGDVDFPLPMVRMTNVSGKVVTADGRPLGETMVTISLPGPFGGSNSGYGVSRATGAFDFRNITPGQYSMLARSVISATGGVPTTTLWAAMDLSLDGRDANELTVTLQPGSTVSGRVVFAGSGATPPEMSRVRVSLESDSPAIRSFGFSIAAVTPAADGSFTFSAVGPSKYRLTATIQSAGASGWTVKSSVMNGQDAELPVEIRLGEPVTNAVVTMTDKSSELSGVFRDANGAPTTDYAVAVFSTDRRHWTRGSRRVVGPLRPGADGRFVVRDLPAGEYFLAAAMDIDANELFNFSVLEDLASKAMRITLAEGEKRSQDVKIGGL
jgi:hypothetical protein